MGLAAVGCGTHFSGTYSGTETGTRGGAGVSATFTFNLIQDNNTIRGTWESTSSTASPYEGGSVSGTANGKNIDGLTFYSSTYTPSNNLSSCTGIFTGTATLENDRITATRVGATSGTGAPSCGATSMSIITTKNK